MAALCAALAAGLASMVANLTYGKKGYEAAGEDMKRVALRAQALKADLLKAVDLDTRAFNAVMEAYRLPKGTEAQIQERDLAVEAASKEATLVPLGVLRASVEVCGLAETAAREGNRNSVSDAGVAGLAARAAGEGAYYNVRINLPNIKDDAFKVGTLGEAEMLKARLADASAAVARLLEKALRG